MRLVLIYCLFIASYSFGQQISKNDKSFEAYLKSFKQVELPIKLNRKNIFELSKINETEKEGFAIVSERFLNFIPIDIVENNPIKNFRCIYIFANEADFITVIIAKDFVYDDEQRKLNLYLINYNKNGNILDFMELAGYHVDIFEKFVRINKDLQITSNEYQFKPHPDKKNMELAYL